VVTGTTVSWRLKAVKDAPVVVGDKVMVLRYTPDDHGGVYQVMQMAKR
jgi:hypothetical protein